MKGLATALLCVVWIPIAGMAGPLEMSLGGGPSATSLDAVNEAIGMFNSLIEHLNETFAVHPDVDGAVPSVPPIGSGLHLHAAERYWITDWFAFGGQIAYATSSTSATGTYVGEATSEIAVDLAYHAVGGTLGAEATFLDVGLRLGVFGGIGYTYALFDRRTLFEIPSEYPDVIAGVPPSAEGRYTGGTLGFEAGLALTYPIAPWLAIGSRLSYRSARVSELTDSSGAALDLDGDGVPEPLSLTGFAVQLAVSVHIDLSLDGRKE